MIVGLVCRHVAREGAPVGLVSHQRPEDPDDSGWLVACGAAGHQDADWLVADLASYFEAPDTADLRQMAEGFHAVRRSANDSWQTELLTRKPPSVLNEGTSADAAGLHLHPCDR